MGKKRDKWLIREACSDNDLLVLDDPEGYRGARITAFGCVEYTRYLEREPPEDKMTLHICDLDGEIERLQQLRLHAKRHFKVWPPAPATPGQL